jgi:glucosamine--fructose-6-phosphate aminotransferase (isomerizing)
MEHYRHELLEQPAVLLATATALTDELPLLEELAARVALAALKHVVITGMGGSLFAGHHLALQLAAGGWPVTLIETAELLYSCPALLTPRSLLIVISQSGETVEVRRLLARLPTGQLLVGVTNGRHNTLARTAGLSLASRAGAERSVAGKSYVCGLLVLDAIGRTLTGQRLAPARWQPAIEAVAGLLAEWESLGERLMATLGPARPLFLLARGASLSSALAGALMLKEASHQPAEGMSAAQFRHGPLEMAGPGMGALLFAPAAPTQPLLLGLAGELAAAGLATVLVGPSLAAQPAATTLLATPPLDPWLAPLAEIVPVQVLCHRLALAAGHEPGHFTRIEKVTRSE